MWKKIEPDFPEGIEVLTKISDEKGDRNEAKLIKQGNLWFSGEIYVYYTPTHYFVG